MHHLTWLVSLGVAAGITPAAPAQERSPGPGIAEATWEQYRGEYVSSPLCRGEEITLWTCQKKQRVFSLCASRAISRTAGYLQYRVSNNGKTELTYPAVKRPPLGLFIYNSFPNGDASVEFMNKGYKYTLVDPLRTSSSLLVAEPLPSDKIVRISCDINQTLQLNYTMRLMHDAGIWSD